MQDDCMPNKMRTIMKTNIDGSEIEVVGKNQNGDVVKIGAKIKNVVNYSIINIVRSMRDSDIIRVSTPEARYSGEVVFTDSKKVKFNPEQKDREDFEIIVNSKDEPPYLSFDDNREIITAVEITSRTERDYNSTDNKFSIGG